MKAKRRRKNHDAPKKCYLCENCLYIGEGDYICDTNNDIVIKEWQPTEDYYSCKGKCFIALKGADDEG